MSTTSQDNGQSTSQEREEPELPYYCGQRAGENRPSTRVRVYRRSDAPGIFMTRAWDTTDSGRPKEKSLPTGITPKQAVELAKETVAKRKARLTLGLQGSEEDCDEDGEGPALEDVLERYHNSGKAKNWGKKHRRNQDRHKRFWEERVGKRRDVTTLEPDTIERVSAAAADRKDWAAETHRKYRTYPRDALKWAARKTDLLDRNPLAAVEPPEREEADTSNLVYSEEQVRKLCTPHPGVDFRVTLASNLHADLGRRTDAIAHIRKGEDDRDPGDLQWRDDGLWIHFDRAFDKGSAGAWVPVSDHTASVIEEALERPEVQDSPWLLPGGRLVDPVEGKERAFDDDRDKPITVYGLIDLLHEAEETLDIPHRKGRAFHGIKRRHVSAAGDVANGDMGKVGRITGNRDTNLLEKTYRSLDTEGKRKHVVAVRRRIEGES